MIALSENATDIIMQAQDIHTSFESSMMKLSLVMELILGIKQAVDYNLDVLSVNDMQVIHALLMRNMKDYY